MPGLPRKSSAVVTTSLVFLLFGAVGCGNRTANDGETNSSVEAVSATQQAAGTVGMTAGAEAAGESAAALGYQSTPINPMRTAYLTAQSEGAQINVRSQPTTQSDSLGFGLSGNEVVLLRLAEGEGGYSWYFLNIEDSQTAGWIRGDFIDTSGEAVASAQNDEPDAADAEEAPDDQGVCGRARQEAYFETDSLNIFICNTGNGLRYVSLDKENQESLVTEDVMSGQGTYVAIDGNYQYHLTNNALAVYRVNQGDYEPLANETVIRHEQFIY